MKRVLIYCLAVLMVADVFAQGSSDPCPFFKNPTTFGFQGTSGTASFRGWSARVGQRIASGASSGYTVYSTCAASNCQDIVGHSNITASSRNTGSDAGINCCNHDNLWDAAQDHRFMIITHANAGIDQLTVNGSNGMQRIPPGYTSCIRLGDPRASYDGASGSAQWNSGNANKSSEALFYTLRVTPNNALLIINYAVVGRCFSHEPEVAGEFLIRVVKQDTNGTWLNEPINDSLWFRISAPPIPASGTPDLPWMMGRPGDLCASTTCAYVYKPWTKVAISLSQYLYQTVRVEMYTSDCVPTVDPLYAYICGDYRPMTLLSTSCPDPDADVIDTLTAPPGMLSYTWYVSTADAVQNIYNTDQVTAAHFRLVQDSSLNDRYMPRIEDFIITEGPSAGDTALEKTFRCVMTSAMDPSKPMHSMVYVNIKNRRPIIDYEWHGDCNGTVTFQNYSHTDLAAGIDPAATYWVVYADTLCTLPLDTVWGELATYTFPRAGRFGVKLYCATASDGNTSSCGAAKSFVCRAMGLPPAAFTVNKQVLCEGQSAMFTCTEGCDLQKSWTIDDSVYTSSDDEPLNMLVKRLEKGTHAVTLTTVNEDGCSSTVSNTVTVYGVPELNISGDRYEICLGDTVRVTATGNGDECQWNSSPVDSALATQQGQSTIVVCPRKTTTYYLMPSSSNPCSDEGATFTIKVLPRTKAAVHSSLPSVSADDNTLYFSDATPNRLSTRWLFSDGVQDSGLTVRHSFYIGDNDSVSVWMESCNRAGCCGDTTLWLPVVPVGVWFANVFAPSEGDRFGMITAMPVKGFEIYIYNREGLLVHHSEDHTALWDGTDLNGRPCVQGAYVYWYRYTTNNLGWHEGHGTVTLLR